MKVLFAILVFGVFSSSYANLKSDSRQTCDKKHCYFINQGVVFKGKKPSSDNPDRRIHGTSLPWSSNVKSLIIHNGQLVVLQKNGKVWMWATDRSQDSYWVQLTKNGKKLYADRDNLYLITKDGKLLAHDNDLNIRWTKMSLQGLTQGSARNVFYDTDQEDVKKLDQSGRKTIVIHKDGEKTDIYGFEISTQDYSVGETQGTQLGQSELPRDKVKEIDYSGFQNNKEEKQKSRTISN